MMDSIETLKVISRYRGDAIVVPTYTANREWPLVSTNPDLDLYYRGAMGKASSVGLGLALARPDKKVMLFDSDGALLMNLGTLVTIAHMAPPNLVHFVFNNGVYRSSGGQPIPARDKLNFITLAMGAGYINVHEFEKLEDLESKIETVLNQVGPTFVDLKLVRATERTPFPPVLTRDIISRFKTALQRSS